MIYKKCDKERFRFAYA